MKDILEKCHSDKVEIHDTLIPEFPFTKSDESANPSYIDYVVFSECGKTVYLVELKTAMKSIEPEQVESCSDLNTRGFSSILGEVKRIAVRTDKDNHPIYAHLLHALFESPYCKVDSDFESQYSSVCRSNCEDSKIKPAMWRSDMEKLMEDLREEVDKRDPEVKVVYIQPKCGEKPDPKFEVITFDCIEKIKIESDLFRLFKRSLRKIRETDASMASLDSIRQ